MTRLIKPARLVAATLAAGLVGGAHAATIGVTNTGSAVVVDSGGNTGATVSNWSLSGGNTVVVYFAGEQAKSLSATYGGEAMTIVQTVVEGAGYNSNNNRWAAAIAYIINPSASTADIELSWTNEGTKPESVHMPISLENVGSVVATQSKDAPGGFSFGYTTTEDGGFVVGAGGDNTWNSTPTPMSASGNVASTTLRDAANSGNFGSLFVYGGVATAGAYTDNLNNTNAAAGVAFDPVPEPGSLALMAIGGLLMLRRGSAQVARRRRSCLRP